jgi:hypothetical protein
MILANTVDGLTLSFDLRDAIALSEIRSLLRTGRVTALTVSCHHTQQVLTVPKRFRAKPVFGVELVSNGDNSPIAERVYVQVDDIRVTLTRTFASKLIRCDLSRIGRMRYDHLGGVR